MLPKSQKVFFGARSLIHKNCCLTPALILLLQEKYVTEKRRFTDTFLQSTDVFLHYRAASSPKPYSNVQKQTLDEVIGISANTYHTL